MMKKALVMFVIAGLVSTLNFYSFNNTNTAQAVAFATRCADSGVVFCADMNVLNDVSSYLTYDDNGTVTGEIDTSIKASGAGSLRFVTPEAAFANATGAYDRQFNINSNGYGPIGGTNMDGQTFYVQLRQRFSPEMLSSAMTGDGWTQFILTSSFGYYGDPIEISLQNYGFTNEPQLVVGGTLIQQNPDDGTDVSYVANEWMTFMIRVTVGTWGQNNSTIEVWAARENTALERIVNRTNITLTENPSDVGSGYNKILVGPYNYGSTGADTGATTWYDELIVSSESIDDAYTPVDSTPPTAPTLVATANSTTAELTWSGSTDGVGVTGYKIYRDAVEIADQAGTTYNDTGLSAGTYAYTVKAYDAATNLSVASNSDDVTIVSPTPPPPPPSSGGGGGGGSSRPRTPPPPPPVATPTEPRHPRATLVNYNGTIYFLGTDLRYPFPSAAVFLSWGVRFEDVVPANTGDIAMPVGPTVEFKTPTEPRHPRATLVNHNGTIFFLGTEVRYPFPSAEVFLSWGVRFEDVVPANSGDIAMPVGPTVQTKQ